MKDMLQKLSPREKLILSIGVIIFVLFTGYMGLIRPVTAALDVSQREQAAAEARYNRVASMLASYTPAAPDTSPAAQQQTVPLRRALTNVSRRTTITISRLQPGANGALTVWIDGTDMPSLARWIVALEAEYGHRVQKATLAKNSDGTTIRAQIQFQGDAG